MRSSLHGGRQGSAFHNDHGFDSPHLDKTKKNKFYFPNRKAKNCVEAELQTYEYFYSEFLQKQNAKHLQRRQPSRVMTMEKLMNAPRYRAREEILQIGDKNESVTTETLEICSIEYIKWKMKRFSNNYGFISLSVHCDETTDHGHERGTWFYHDSDGVRCPGLAKALEEAGIPLPDPTKPVSRNNCREMTYTKMCREKWHEIILSHGIEIETQPDKQRTTPHMGVDAYKALEQAKEALREENTLEQEKWLKTQNTRLQEQWKAESEKLRQSANKILVKKKKELEAQYQQKLQDLKRQESANREAIAVGRQVLAENVSKNVEKPERDLPDLPFEIK